MVSGTVIPISAFGCITVDYWRSNGARHVLARFCTHAHADHLQGLSAAWTGAPIYCSVGTKALLLLRWPDMKARVVALEHGEISVLTLPSPGGPVTLNVILLDANHCLGAVMFLFEGAFGRLLHTGDFRWEAEFLQDMLRDPWLTSAALDMLYLDNTYANPRYEFPTRLEACHEVIRLVHAHPHHAIVIAVDSLGKEELLAAVAADVREQVCLPPERFPAVDMLGLPHGLFTTDPCAARIHASPRHQVTLQYVAKLNRRRPTIAIMPSGYCTYAAQQAQAQPAAAPAPACVAGGAAAPVTGAVTPAELEAAARLVFKVPYSLHCSYAELRDFVGALRPRRLVCTVSGRIEPEVSNDACVHFADLLPAGHGALLPPPGQSAGRRMAPLAGPLQLPATDAMESSSSGTPTPAPFLQCAAGQQQCQDALHDAQAGAHKRPSDWRSLLANARASINSARVRPRS